MVTCVVLMAGVAAPYKQPMEMAGEWPPATGGVWPQVPGVVVLK